MGRVYGIARRLFASVFVSVLLAALLSMLPLLDQVNTEKEVPAFGPSGDDRLEAGNLVDFLVKEGEGWEWERADWNDGRLELVGRWSGSSSDGVYEDLFRLTRSALVYTANVEELHVSATVGDSTKILVLRASRQQLGHDTQMENGTGFTPQEYLQRNFHLTVADRDD
ncbi:hypothetical protein [Desmospora activa]|uniref:Uncharacterized protein n=1 Tax=Desmospora activa DSM 45169 TaxID=1121389 RepID=A0A2T4Z9W6_9BACL|nr:hypothetical protein [Desmospora activa]PTM58677.1 hypothetical protein C8J48_1265 [Desmospora activa DSM 45169]